MNIHFILEIDVQHRYSNSNGSRFHNYYFFFIKKCLILDSLSESSTYIKFNGFGKIKIAKCR
jgi:hypothetical protein